MGGSVAIEAFASDRPPAADRLVLISPGVWGWSTQPLPYKTTLWLAAHLDAVDRWSIRPTSSPSTSTRRTTSTSCAAWAAIRWRCWGARADALYGLVAMMERASRDVGRIQDAGALSGRRPRPDHPRAGARKGGARPQPGDERSAFYANGWHLLIVDKEREIVFRDIESFIRDPGAPLPSGAPRVPGAGGR